MKSTTATAAELKANDAFTVLRKVFPAGSDVFVNVHTAAASGMSRTFRVLGIWPALNGYPAEIGNVSYYVATVTGYPLNRDGSAVRVKGCNADMGALLVMDIAKELYGDPYALNPRRIS